MTTPKEFGVVSPVIWNDNSKISLRSMLANSEHTNISYGVVSQIFHVAIFFLRIRLHPVVKSDDLVSLVLPYKHMLESTAVNGPILRTAVEGEP